MAELYVALLHHPVYDKNGDIVTTAITNIDVHDIARTCKTFGVSGFYVVTPVDALRGLARKILHHWQAGYGSTYNANRTEALDLVQLERTLEGVEIDIEASTGKLPVLVATSARACEPVVPFARLRADLEQASAPHLLLFGTGWGLAEEVMSRAAMVLEPVAGVGPYNHLSVRAAAAIILDRLRGTR